ncbi:hypothetical protein ACC772_40375, partial [Rhizobium ruizarguesonis]
HRLPAAGPELRPRLISHAPVAAGRLPMDEVREALERRSGYFGRIEKAAEAFAETLPWGVDIAAGLKDWLRSERGIA